MGKGIYLFPHISAETAEKVVEVPAVATCLKTEKLSNIMTAVVIMITVAPAAQGFRPTTSGAVCSMRPANGSRPPRNLYHSTPLNPEASATVPTATALTGGETSRADSTRLHNKAVLGGGGRFDRFAEFLLKTQEDICRQAAASDGIAGFCSDSWARDGPSKGFGLTRVLEGGDLLEKAACSVSIIHGTLSPERAQAMSSRGRAGVDSRGGQAYSAAALSLVFHTASPLVPTFRADVRYLEVDGEGWFGGGADLTPYYLNDEDVSKFHKFYKGICDQYDLEAYPRFKKWADDYFYIDMRKEHRGVGGIFFDDLERLGDSDGTGDGKGVESFVREVARGFMPSFLPIAERRGRLPYTEKQRQWQLMRRGRYLEFNLLYDRGVKFGLSGGRVESIMVSAPPLVSWTYNHVPEEGSEEERLVEILRNPRDWAF